jgi:hypothetical protein
MMRYIKMCGNTFHFIHFRNISMLKNWKKIKLLSIKNEWELKISYIVQVYLYVLLLTFVQPMKHAYILNKYQNSHFFEYFLSYPYLPLILNSHYPLPLNKFNINKQAKIIVISTLFNWKCTDYVIYIYINNRDRDHYRSIRLY